MKSISVFSILFALIFTACKKDTTNTTTNTTTTNTVTTKPNPGDTMQLEFIVEPRFKYTPNSPVIFDSTTSPMQSFKYFIGKHGVFVPWNYKVLTNGYATIVDSGQCKVALGDTVTAIVAVTFNTYAVENRDTLALSIVEYAGLLHPIEKSFVNKPIPYSGSFNSQDTLVYIVK